MYGSSQNNLNHLKRDDQVPPDVSCPLFAALIRKQISLYSNSLRVNRINPDTFSTTDIQEYHNDHELKMQAEILRKKTNMDPLIDGHIIVPGLINALVRKCDLEKYEKNPKK